MNLREIEAIDSHTAGEPTRIVTGGLPDVPGRAMTDKRSWLRDNLDWLRTALVLEPRGHDAIVLAYILPPVADGADLGVIFANDAGYLGMCGHGTIGVVTSLIASGRIEVHEPETKVVLDTPAGLIEATAHIEGGRPVAVTMQNIPSFLYRKDVSVEVPGVGELLVDISYGGNWFGLVPQESVGIPLEMANLRRLMDVATCVRTALDEAGVHGFDPQTGEAHLVDHIEIIGSREVPDGLGARTLTLCPGTAYDRSPCGTGTSAKLAAMHARGKLAMGQELHNQSITGTEFIGQVVGETTVGEHAAVIPQVRGAAYVTGYQRFVFDPHDPLVHGVHS
jgi:proline racemase